MQRRGTFLVTLVTLSWLLAIGASVQGGQTPGQAISMPAADATLLRSSTLFGYRIKSPQGEDLGKLEEIMIDMEAKRIAYAVVSFGGFLSLGDKWAPVPWEALTFKSDEKLLLTGEPGGVAALLSAAGRAAALEPRTGRYHFGRDKTVPLEHLLPYECVMFGPASWDTYL
jgi:sporulation protein YlmC with PRC-barrel domain